MPRQSRPADVVAGFFGARGSGKNYGAREHMGALAPRRLFIDPMNEFAGEARKVSSLEEMVPASRAATFSLRYVPPDIVDCEEAELAKRFDAFCRIAWSRTQVAPVDVIVDEGHLFTSPSFAPRAWKACTLLGRHHGMRIWLMSQRPAHVDKHFFTNATFLRTGRLNFDDDIGTMAGALRVPRRAVGALAGHEFIARDLGTRALHSDPALAVLLARDEAAPMEGSLLKKTPPRATRSRR